MSSALKIGFVVACIALAATRGCSHAHGRVSPNRANPTPSMSIKIGKVDPTKAPLVIIDGESRSPIILDGKTNYCTRAYAPGRGIGYRIPGEGTLFNRAAILEDSSMTPGNIPYRVSTK